MTSAARAEFENQMNRYTTNNPYWYRPWLFCRYINCCSYCSNRFD
jgi:hypothetical protein